MPSSGAGRNAIRVAGLYAWLQHFVCFYEDQYDFHTYCLRKMTLTSYVGILRFEDVVRRQPYYVAAAKLATSVRSLWRVANEP